jgi:hypothetical protein
VDAGAVRKIGPRLYTPNMTDPPEVVIRRNLWRVVGLLIPGALIGYRTAFRGAPSVDGSVFVVGKGRQTIDLPGHRIQMVPGPGPLEGDHLLEEGIILASRPRAILECLRLTRRRKYDSRGLTRAAIEEYLESELRIGGEERIIQIYDHARVLAERLDATAAFRALDAMIAALLGRSPDQPAPAIPQAPEEPFDSERIALFQVLHAALARWPERSRPDRHPDDRDFAHLAFFDAYFSNLISGTEFEVGEAHAIVFGWLVSQSRPREAHDLLATFHLVGSRPAMSRGLRDAATLAEYLTRVQSTHAELMAERPDKRPGELRADEVGAGDTTSVRPELIRGTLLQAFELARGLATPFARAAMLAFVLTEVRPFDAGNGRLARALMNAELIAGGERRILIPTDHAEEYLSALRRLSQTGDTPPYLHLLDRAQEYTAAIDFTDYDRALAVLRETGAFEGVGAELRLELGDWMADGG